MTQGRGRPHAGDRFLRPLYARALAANAVGATLAFIYLTVVAPPQPEAPEQEAWLYLGVVPIYFIVAGVLAHRLTLRLFRPIDRWLDEGRAPTGDERALVLSLPWRLARHSGAGWLLAAILFAAETATHHPAAYVAGVGLGIALAGMTTTGITFLLAERLLRPLFALALAGHAPVNLRSGSARTLSTAHRLLVSWALGSGVALVAIGAAVQAAA